MGRGNPEVGDRRRRQCMARHGRARLSPRRTHCAGNARRITATRSDAWRRVSAERMSLRTVHRTSATARLRFEEHYATNRKLSLNQLHEQLEDLLVRLALVLLELRSHPLRTVLAERLHRNHPATVLRAALHRAEERRSVDGVRQLREGVVRGHHEPLRADGLGRPLDLRAARVPPGRPRPRARTCPCEAPHRGSCCTS